MGFIINIVDSYHEVFEFIYGLEFFVLALVIALQSRHHSKLDLARSLQWLAAFNLVQSLHEWGGLFFPIQTGPVNNQIIQFLMLFQLFLVAASFALLFEYGFALIRPQKGRRFLLIPPLVLLLWSVVVFFILPVTIQDEETWFNSANALARYMLAFPGGLLAAYQLKQHTLQHIKPLNVPHLVRTLMVASLALFLYAILVGLVPPPTPFFPGNLINIETFSQTFVVPPLILRSLVGLIFTLSFIRALEIFDVERQRMIEAMEQQQILLAERERIGRELHDGAIQMAYTAGLLVESAYRLADPGSQIGGRLEKASNALNDTIDMLRQSLVGLQPHSLAEPLEKSLRLVAFDPRFDSLLDIQFASELGPEETLSRIRTDHILAILREALSNIVRHACAQQVKIILGCHEDRLKLRIEDDGVGLPRKLEAGYGLRNMRDRARLLGGYLDIRSTNGKGTSLTLEIPRRDET